MERKWSLIDTKNDLNISQLFDGYEACAKKVQQFKQKMKKDFDEKKDCAPVPEEKNFGIVYEKSNLSKTEKELLYIEALYTIKHKIGRTIDGHSDYKNDLNLYLQDAFKISSEDHERLLAKVKEEKPPVLILNVEVVEAKKLRSKGCKWFFRSLLHVRNSARKYK